MNLTVYQVSLYVVVGLAASALGSMSGLGGGFIAVPTLYYLGLGPSFAVATAKFMVMVNSLVSSIRYSKRLRPPLVLYASVVTPMIATSYLGAYLVSIVPPKPLAATVSAVLLAGSVRLVVGALRGRDSSRGGRDVPVNRHVVLVGSASGALSGLVAGLTGLGGGIVNVPVFMYVLGLTPHRAVSLSMACILPAAITSVARHVADGRVVFNVAIPLAVGAVLGGWVGPRAAMKLSGRALRTAIGIIIAAASARILIESVLTALT